jgi:DNA polymerase-1
MQNQPKNKLARRHFKTKKGRILVSFDYSQAELRSLAVLSGDKNLLDIFRSGKDMHAAVAAKVYGKEFTSLSPYLPDSKIENPIYAELRRRAKTINFGIVYGATEYTLMERLGISFKEANALIIGWFALFPDAKCYMDECRSAPRQNRPLITVFGRQRRFYVVHDANMNGQENEAGNFPHQSMCSDFTLASSIQIDKHLEKYGKLPGNAKQCNIVHDDNVFECDDDEMSIRKLVNFVIPIMEDIPKQKGIHELTFKVDSKKGRTWAELSDSLEF